MKQAALRLLLPGIALLVILGFISQGWAQSHKLAIGTGRMQLYVVSLFADKSDFLHYPRENEVYRLQQRYFEKKCADGAGIVIAARNFPAKAYYPNENPIPTEWVVRDTLMPYIVADATAWYTVDKEHVTVPVAGGARRYWKYRPPARMVSNENLSLSDWLDGKDFDGPADLPTEQMGTATVHTYMGITVTQRAYVFGLDAFAIVEYVFKNTGQTGSYDDTQEITYSDTVQDCYVGIKFRPILSGGTSEERVVPNSGGWKEGTDEWVDYVHSLDGEVLRVLYGWDGDAGDFHQAEDDEGDPLYFSSGVFTAPQYPGMAVLHADRSPIDHTNDPDQPRRFHASFGGTYATNILSMGRQLTFEDIYKVFDEGPSSPSPFDFEGWKADSDPGNDNQYWTGYQTSDPTAENRYNQMGTLGFGPYDFGIGDSVRIVLCYAVGTIDWSTAIELGAQYKNGTITRGEKNEVLRSGRDSLFARIQWIQDLFDDRFVANDGDLGVTLQQMSSELGVPPAWPANMILDPVVGGCRVEWTAVGDAVAYRVYRRDRIDFDLAEPSIDPAYSLVYQCGGDDPGGGIEFSPTIDSTVWVDTQVYPVFNYWYYITSVSAEGLESSHFFGRTYPKTTDLTYGSVQPYDRERYDLTEIHVLPNPYNVKSLKLYDWSENKLTFHGLPASCRIRIFSQNGVMVFRDHHVSDQGLPESSYNWDMRSLTDQTIASGMYIYVIDKCKTHNGDPIGDTKVGKFVVIK
ncbi:MAG: hypothetical protein JSW54_00620 [Fidelibacterota bacterium]|nr:MAG: hypothetical protein JSW54_00620 [Candidatus Neomarinimicrobiota bacterium]